MKVVVRPSYPAQHSLCNYLKAKVRPELPPTHRASDEIFCKNIMNPLGQATFHVTDNQVDIYKLPP